MIEEGIIVFNSTHDSIKADNICLKKNIDASLIPTHPSITSGCGFMMKVSWNKFSDLIKVLENNDVNYKSFYYSTKKGIKRELTILYENK